MYTSTLSKFQGKGGGKLSTGTVQDTEDETKPLLSATKQKQFLGAWRNYRSGAAAENNGDDSENGKKENGTEDKEASAEHPKWMILLKSVAYLTVGVIMVTVFSDPMVSALTALTEKNNANYNGKSGIFRKGQYIPIGVFYISFVITPLCSNASELVSSLMFAAKKTKINTSLTFSQLYGAVTMNNTLGLGIFAALVYFQNLDWQYSAEVTVILFMEFTIGIAVIIAGFGYKHTYIVCFSS
ncbi:Sodium/calcium exchanger NCL1 [Geodia barretti]|uniref:Sodium/calcium exchanger NCL1 n=3 Tax=Geodia barretti TaxID=519541 RepID=A0AA35QW43_GEOBA|nr:Sodium/calcium exchanger NCL1 [Geodia barretti]